MLYACNKGFQLTFDNKLTISVMFGKGNYCDNRNIESDGKETRCENAAIAVMNNVVPLTESWWYGDGFGANNGGGWFTADQVARCINMVRLFNTERGKGELCRILNEIQKSAVTV